MRLYEVEYSKDELAQLREELRREYPDLTEEQLDEVLPLIPLALGTAARVGAGAIARGAMGAGRLAAKGIGAAARGIGKAAKGAAGLGKQGLDALGKAGTNQIKKQVAKKVSNNLSLGGRTDQSGQGNDPAAEINAMAQANNELQATYQAKVKEIEKSLSDMKKSLKLQ